MWFIQFLSLSVMLLLPMLFTPCEGAVAAVGIARLVAFIVSQQAILTALRAAYIIAIQERRVLAAIELQKDMMLLQSYVLAAQAGIAAGGFIVPGSIPIRKRADGSVDLDEMLRLLGRSGLLTGRNEGDTGVNVLGCVEDVVPLQDRSWELGTDYLVIDQLPASCMTQAYVFKAGNASGIVESLLGGIDVLNGTALKFKDLDSASVAVLGATFANFTESIRTEATTPYNYYGCFTEATAGRALTGATHIDYVDMDIQTCSNLCLTAGGFALFGVEYGGECYCGNTLAAGAVRAFDTGCDMACSGNNVQLCGGRSRLSLYGVSATAPTITFPPGVPPVTHFTSLGCYTEVAPVDGARALAGQIGVSPVMTTQACADFCRDNGLLLFGTEYGSECYCGSALHGESAPAPTGDCAMPCSGDAAQICGGPNRLSLYQWSV